MNASIKVVDKKGKALSNKKILIDGKLTRTNKDGVVFLRPDNDMHQIDVNGEVKYVRATDGFEFTFNVSSFSLKDLLPQKVSKKRVLIFIGILLFIGMVISIILTPPASPSIAPDMITSDAVEAPITQPAAEKTVTGIQLNTPGIPKLKIVISLSTIGFSLIILSLLLETFSRKGWLSLFNFLAPPITIIGLTMRQHLPDDLWVTIITISIILQLVAIFNESGKKEGVQLSAIDFTSLAATSALMLILHHADWKLIPYPTYFPIWAVWIIFIAAIARELFRTPLIAILSAGLAVIMAITLNPLVITGGLVILVIVINIGVIKGWVTQSGHKAGIPINIGKRQLSLVVPWDNFLSATVIFIMVSYQLYGNFTLLTIGR